MRLEERELADFAVPVTPGDLKEGSVYFSVNFIDREMLIPTMDALVYVGKNLEPGDRGQLYFQDIDSYQRGISYETAEESDSAQFLLESEEGLYLFEFEQALDELLRCLLRRREKRVSVPIIRAHGFQSLDEPPQSLPNDTEWHSLRFDEADLQESLVAALRNSELAFDIRHDGAVLFAAADSPAVHTVARRLRGNRFRWYFSWWKDPESTHLFWEEMKAAGLPFLVEHHDDRVIFLLPKGSEDLHDVISGRVQMRMAQVALGCVDTNSP